LRNFSVALRKYNRKQSPHWKTSYLLSSAEGATAKKLIEFMKNIEKRDPFSKGYNLRRGPNLNTFVDWILDQNNYLGWKSS